MFIVFMERHLMHMERDLMLLWVGISIRIFVLAASQVQGMGTPLIL